jgi:hypothetical protein
MTFRRTPIDDDMVPLPRPERIPPACDGILVPRSKPLHLAPWRRRHNQMTSLVITALPVTRMYFMVSPVVVSRAKSVPRRRVLIWVLD